MNLLDFPPSLMTFNPHAKSVAKVVATTSTLVVCGRPRWLRQCTYVDDEAQKGKNDDSEVGSRHGYQ
jgi:hypothetical protein